jgi:hypothetical protein
MLLEYDFARLYVHQIALLINSGYKEPYFKADWWIKNDGMAVTSRINHSGRGALESNIYKQVGYAVDNVNVVNMYWNLETQGTAIFMAQHHLVGHYRSLWSSSDTPHSLGLLWTNDQPDAETCTWKNTQKRQTFVPPAGFEPAIPASERRRSAPKNWILQKTEIILAMFPAVATIKGRVHF